MKKENISKTVSDKFYKTMFSALCKNYMEQNPGVSRADAIKAMAAKYPEKLTEAIQTANEE